LKRCGLSSVGGELTVFESKIKLRFQEKKVVEKFGSYAKGA
jgi:hypothetical protein